MAREVHVTTTSADIGRFMEADRTPICYRCGQQGHLRYQCLTFKVRLCWHHRNGGCPERNCTFAHGVGELRQPWMPRCVRVVKQPGGQVVCIGCNSTEHTFRRCPHQTSLLL